MKTSLLSIALLSGFVTCSLSARPDGMPPRPDPETVVVTLFEFDADENDSLSQEELVNGLRETRGQHRGDRGPGKGGKKGKKMGGEKGPGKPDGKPAEGKKGKRRGPPSPDQAASRMIERFDGNGDGELNPEELLDAVTAMHERRGPGRRGPAAGDTAE